MWLGSFREENWGRDVAPQPSQHPFTSLSSSLQTNLTSDTETPNINTRRRLGKMKEAGTRQSPTPPQSKWRWKPKEIMLLIFNSVQCCWSEAPFFPSFLYFMAVFGTSCKEKEFLGFSRKWVLASQLNTRKLTLLKTSTSASGLGQRERGRRFITFQKFKLKVGLFWHILMKFEFQSRRVLTACHRRPLFWSARGYHKRQEGEWKEA